MRSILGATNPSLLSPVPPFSLNARLRSVLESPEGILARRLALVLAAYTAVRLVFLVEHRGQFAESSALTIAWAFVQGVRFDLSAIAYSNAPFILLSLAPVALLAARWYQRALMTLFVAVNAAAVMIMMGDVGYYPFTGTRVTMDVFALTGEATAQFDQLLVNFAGLVSVTLVLVAGLVVGYPRSTADVRADGTGHERTRGTRSLPRVALGVFAVLALTVLAARGGLQKKPLNPIHAFASGQHEVGILTLNSAFTLLHSPRVRELEPVEFFADDRDADALIRAPYGYAAAAGEDAPRRPQNVVLLILESFGTEFWGGDSLEQPGLTPFLDSLRQHGTFLTNAFANGRRSMDALPSILLGVPLYSGRSIAVSGFQSNEWRGLGHFLEDAGFHTSMFHGAPKGTMYFDAIAAMSGIQDFYPMERFPDDVQRDGFDGHWGLFDEPALQFAARELTTHPEPWFTTLFTISTHHPYRVPQEYQATLPEGSREIHQSVAYVDLAVREFFETARTQPWFENTLFIITGDHTPPLRSPRYDTALGRYMVPVLLYHPTTPLPAVDATRITQHVDLFATVLDYTGVRPERVPAFGRSLFANVPGEAVLTSDNTYWMVRKEGVVERLPDGSERVFAYQRERTDRTPAELPAATAERLSQRLLAHVQHYTMSMINNSFYRELPPRPVVRGDN
jgi:phosphoglycerol transferase MdoB-like AlkP superfamily enzyme